MKRTSKTPTTTTATKIVAAKKSRPRVKRDLVEDRTVAPEADNVEMMSVTPVAVGQKKKYVFTILALFIVVALAGYKFKYVIVPAKVGNQPVFVWQYVGFMHKTYGKEALQTLSTQILIEQEISRNKIAVKPEDIQHEVDTIDQQASSSGGIKAMLAAQQMTLEQLKDQIRIQLAVKQILKDKIQVSDAEVQDAYVKNKDFFKGVSEADAKAKVRDQLVNQKFQTEASNWLANVRKNTQVQILFPGLR